MTPIPRIIHLIWVGGTHFPYPDYLARWRELHPGWDVRLWTDENRPTLANESIYQRLPSQAMRADLLRLELLEAHGGVYTDADSTPLKPIDPLIDGRTLWMMTGNHGNGGNGTLGCPPGHPGMRELVDGAHAHARRLLAHDEPITVHDLYGGRYVRAVLKRYPDFSRVERRLICPRRAVGPETIIAHGSLNSWKRDAGRKAAAQTARLREAMRGAL